MNDIKDMPGDIKDRHVIGSWLIDIIIVKTVMHFQRLAC